MDGFPHYFTQEMDVSMYFQQENNPLFGVLGERVLLDENLVAAAAVLTVDNSIIHSNVIRTPDLVKTDTTPKPMIEVKHEGQNQRKYFPNASHQMQKPGQTSAYKNTQENERPQPKLNGTYFNGSETNLSEETPLYMRNAEDYQHNKKMQVRIVRAKKSKLFHSKKKDEIIFLKEENKRLREENASLKEKLKKSEESPKSAMNFGI